MTENVKFSQSALSAAACFKRVSIVYVRTYVCMYVCMHVYIFIVCMHVYIFIVCIDLDFVG